MVGNLDFCTNDGDGSDWEWQGDWGSWQMFVWHRKCATNEVAFDFSLMQGRRGFAVPDQGSHLRGGTIQVGISFIHKYQQLEKDEDSGLNPETPSMSGMSVPLTLAL